MKTTYTPLFLLAILFAAIVFTGCAKADTSADLPKEQQVVGEWVINRVQLKLFQNGVFVKDTIIKSTPKPKNFVKFGADGSFEYKLNSTTSDIGTYEFGGAGTLVTNSSPKTYNWTMLTLTNVLFTVVSKGSDPAFPGYYVERYQTFTR
jgi:PBP1b-binding outer membrane lipoprotein LpoB